MMLTINLSENQAIDLLENVSWATSYWGRTDSDNLIIEIIEKAIEEYWNKSVEATE